MQPHPAAGPAGLVREATTDRVYDLLKQRIVDQSFAPAERLRVDAIAASLDVSPTPVREALNRLASERLVVSQPYRGFAVADELDARGYSDLFEACAVVQLAATQAGAVSASPTDTDWLARATVGMDQACATPGYPGFLAFAEWDRAFHRRIALISGNEFLVELWDSLNPHIRLARLYHQAFALGRTATTISSDEHRRIVDAYHTRDAAAATDLMRAHMRSSQRRWVEFASEPRQPRPSPT
jgi:DNA-binding GntR family transcriptional regulator